MKPYDVFYTRLYITHLSIFYRREYVENKYFTATIRITTNYSAQADEADDGSLTNPAINFNDCGSTLFNQNVYLLNYLI